MKTDWTRDTWFPGAWSKKQVFERKTWVFGIDFVKLEFSIWKFSFLKKSEFDIEILDLLIVILALSKTCDIWLPKMCEQVFRSKFKWRLIFRSISLVWRSLFKTVSQNHTEQKKNTNFLIRMGNVKDSTLLSCHKRN